MARIELRNIAHSYVDSPTSEADYALKPLDLVWESGGAYALLGPSGCGKTTLLNIMSGLLRPTRGSVVIDGRDVTTAAPQARNIAQVFQFPVSYDTMTVFDNLAFPLRNRAVRGSELSDRVQRVAALLDLDRDLHRKATQLSADLKQRISLGRGLVRTDVAAILLDEPLTVIDPHAKWQLRRKLRQIHAELKVTLVYVTHDQVEALTLADQVVVMNAGQVLQQGSPQELFERPAHTFVGYFIGSPGMNLLRCQVEADCVVIEGQRIAFDPATCAKALAAGGDFTWGARPEWLRLADTPLPGRRLQASVVRVEELGYASFVTLRMAGQSVVVKQIDQPAPQVGASSFIELAQPNAWLYADGRIVG
jgi:glycerol transport system ATP-binding protein